MQAFKFQTWFFNIGQFTPYNFVLLVKLSQNGKRIKPVEKKQAFVGMNICLQPDKATGYDKTKLNWPAHQPSNKTKPFQACMSVAPDNDVVMQHHAQRFCNVGNFPCHLDVGL